MTLAEELEGYVLQREKAFQHATVTLDKHKAIRTLKAVVHYVKGKSTVMQKSVLRGHKSEILLITPSEQSRFKNVREKMLALYARL